MEGWAPGLPAYENNNPGNLRCGPDPKTWNILASGATSSGFCHFKTADTGMQALKNVTIAQCKGLSPAYNAYAQSHGLANSGELNLLQYFTWRDPKSDGNDPNALAIRFANALDVDPTVFRMKDLLAA